MSYDDSDTERIPAPSPERRGDGISHRELMANLDRVGDRLHALENANKERVYQHASHADEIAELKDLAHKTEAALEAIKALLEGAYGQDGLAVRIKALEAWKTDADRTLWLLQYVGGGLGSVAITALGGALIWALTKSHGAS